MRVHTRILDKLGQKGREMARRIRESTLDTVAARSKLRARGKPYYRAIARGLHLGFRKNKRGGVWVVRRYIGNEDYKVETIGQADDEHRDADGNNVLNFYQAQDRAKAHATDAIERIRLSELGAPITVESSIEEYLTDRERREAKQKGGKLGLKRDARSRLKRHVLSDSKLAAMELRALNEDHLFDWRQGMARRRKGDADSTLSESAIRRTANDLKAALNLAQKRYRARLPAALPIIIKNGLAIAEAKGIATRAGQILPDADIRAIIKAAEQVDQEGEWGGDLARLVLVLAASGSRFSQAARISVGDVKPTELQIMMPVSRKGRGEKAVSHTRLRVGEDVMAALRPVLAGRKGHEPLLLRPRWRQVEPMKWEVVSRESWHSAAELSRPWAAILSRAGLPKGIVPYALRDSSIVRCLVAGLPVRLVAALHDTSSAMIERHYSAHIVDAMDELAARAIVPLVAVFPTPLRRVR
jgi:integrase